MSSCGNPTTGGEDGLMPRRLKYDKTKDCIKCKASPGKIVIRHAVYCKDCFVPLVTLKFRRALEPFVNASAGTSNRPKLKASGSLVLGFSGGLGSSILLDMVYKTYFTTNSSVSGERRGGTNHPRSSSVWTSCTTCYVEVCSAFPETRDRTNEIVKALVHYPKFDFVSLRLEHAFDDSWWNSVTTTSQNRTHLEIELGKDGLYTEALRHASSHNLSPIDSLRTYLASLPTQTAISSAIRVLVRLLLLYTARSRQASHLLLGTSLTTLSISLISSISQGGGHSIPEEFQEEWNYGIPTPSNNANVIRIVRPLRDVTMKECSVFAWWNSIHVVGRDRQTRATDGIPGLTKDFIVGLEKNYPSTVSTIARTCAKLEPGSASLGQCILCQRSIQEGLDDWQGQISIRSYSDEKLRPDLVHLPVTAPTNRDVLTLPDRCSSISTQLCYSCRTSLTSRGSRASKATQPVIHSVHSPSSAPLPLWAAATCAQYCTQDGQPMISENCELWAGTSLDEATRRNEIADFLLDK